MSVARREIGWRGRAEGKRERGGMRVQFVAAAHGTNRANPSAAESTVCQQPPRRLGDLDRVPIGVSADSQPRRRSGTQRLADAPAIRCVMLSPMWLSVRPARRPRVAAR